jgi:hypothetical protein
MAVRLSALRAIYLILLGMSVIIAGNSKPQRKKKRILTQYLIYPKLKYLNMELQ